MNLLDQVMAPGSALGGGLKSGAGDDRFAFDESAGWACVIDGATDVGPIRIYPNAESDAARYAQIFADQLIAHPAQTDETTPAYIARLAGVVGEAALRAARFPRHGIPLASYPTAAATYLRARNGRLEGATLGDTIAIVRQPDGAISLLGDGGKPADESARARRVMAMTPEQRLTWLQDLRAIHNTDRGYWVFGVQPEAAAKVVHQIAPCPPGTRVLLMTDGFYRLVSPYGRYDDAALIARAGDAGLGSLLSDLRGLEASPEDDASIGRFKTSDDATALLLEF